MSILFDKAFNLSMQYEVGPWWNPSDPEVIMGAVATAAQQRKVGYVNIEGDSGGQTKYGIAQSSHPNINIKTLDLDAAKNIYLNGYWTPCQLDSITSAISLVVFDIAVNMGTGRAVRLLQEAVGTAVDGFIGPQTITATNAAQSSFLITRLTDLRKARYNEIAANNPEDEKFLNGWLSRADHAATAARLS